jgi:hypothetical protein
MSVPAFRRTVLRLLAVAVSAGMVLAVAAPGADAAPALPGGGALSSTTYYDNDLVASTSVVTVPSAGVSAFGFIPPQAKCMVSALEYKIYQHITGYVYLTWKFSIKWCYAPYQKTVTQVDPTDSLTIFSPAIRWSHGWSKYVGPLNKFSVRMLYDGAEFQYCPVLIGGANCIGAFHPKIDLYFQGDSTILDMSVT